MAIQIQSFKCPECGATLQGDNKQAVMFCSYCGARLSVTNDNENVYRIVDDAEMTRAETERAVAYKHLDILDRKQAILDREAAKREQADADKDAKKAAVKRAMKIKRIIAIVVAVLIILALHFDLSGIGPFLLIGEIVVLVLIHHDRTRLSEIGMGDKVRVPSIASSYSGKNFAVVESAFISAGFTNVRCVPLNDLKLGVRNKAGEVDSVSVYGKESSMPWRSVPADAPVIISYHSFPSK